MAVNEKLTNRVRELLIDVSQVHEKRMFSGVAFMVDYKLCIAVRNDNIMCRINPDLHDKLVEEPGCSSMIMKGKSLAGYVVVDESVLATKKQLDYWVKLALDYNPIAKSSKKTTSKQRINKLP